MKLLAAAVHTLEWPHFWSPHSGKDVVALESGMLPGMERFSFKERLDGLGLFSLEPGRLKGDLLGTFMKVMRGIHCVDRRRLLPCLGESKR